MRVLARSQVAERERSVHSSVPSSFVGPLGGSSGTAKGGSSGRFLQTQTACNEDPASKASEGGGVRDLNGDPRSGKSALAVGPSRQAGWVERRSQAPSLGKLRHVQSSVRLVSPDKTTPTSLCRNPETGPIRWFGGLANHGKDKFEARWGSEGPSACRKLQKATSRCAASQAAWGSHLEVCRAPGEKNAPNRHGLKGDWPVEFKSRDRPARVWSRSGGYFLGFLRRSSAGRQARQGRSNQIQMPPGWDETRWELRADEVQLSARNENSEVSPCAPPNQRDDEAQSDEKILPAACAGDAGNAGGKARCSMQCSVKQLALTSPTDGGPSFEPLNILQAIPSPVHTSADPNISQRNPRPKEGRSEEEKRQNRPSNLVLGPSPAVLPYG